MRVYLTSAAYIVRLHNAQYTPYIFLIKTLECLIFWYYHVPILGTGCVIFWNKTYCCVIGHNIAYYLNICFWRVMRQRTVLLQRSDANTRVLADSVYFDDRKSCQKYSMHFTHNIFGESSNDMMYQR